MKHDKLLSGKRKPLNVTIDTGIVQRARDVGLNLSKISEAALVEAIRCEHERRWLEENRAALDSSNKWVEKNGLPFANHRPF